MRKKIRPNDLVAVIDENVKKHVGRIKVYQQDKIVFENHQTFDARKVKMEKLNVI